MGKFFIFFVFAAVVAACNLSGQKGDNEIAVLDVEMAMDNCQPVKLSDYVASIDYIPFETGENCLIAGFSRYVPFDGGLVNYSSNNHYCYVFDNDGNFKGKVGSRGNAENEYNHILHLTVNDERDEIFIFGVNQKFSKVYDLNTFAYKRTQNVGGGIPDGVYGILETTSVGNYFAVYGTNYYTNTPACYFIDEKDKIVKVDSLAFDGSAYTPDELIFSGKKNQVGVSLQSDALAIKFDLSDTLYMFDKDLNKSARYITDCGKYRLNKDLSNRDNSVSFNLKMMYDTEKFLAISTFVRTNDRIKFMPVETGVGMLSYLLYDKVSKKSHMLPYYKEVRSCAFENDIDGGAPFVIKFMDGNKLYQVIEAIDFIDFADRSNSAKMKAVAETLTEESNPVLVVATLK